MEVCYGTTARINKTGFKPAFARDWALGSRAAYGGGGQGLPGSLVQLAAVKSAINNTGKLILKDHIRHCVSEAVQNGDREALDALSDAIDRFVK